MIKNRSTPGKLYYDWPDAPFDHSIVFSSASQQREEPYDVVIIGAGIVGCALAYHLSQFRLNILLIDRNYDVGEGTSKGSSAIIHTGFDAPVGTLESELVTKSSVLWPQLAEKLKIPFDACGALLLAIDEEQRNQLKSVHEKALKNGVTDVELLDKEQIRRYEPEATDQVLGGLLIPRESIADPFTACIAFAEVAVKNGTDILLGAEITGFENADQPVKTIVTGRGAKIHTKIIVNVAGLGSEKLTKLYGGEHFDTNPRRGQFVIFDKSSRQAIRHILLPIPTQQTKGVLVIPTIFGNLLAGPTAEDFSHDDPSIASTESEKLQKLVDGASKLYPGLNKQPPIGLYSGVRCNCSQGSYLIRCNDNHHGILTVTGIRSTGFTSSPALAEYLANRMQQEMGLILERDPDAADSRTDEEWPGWWKRPYEKENAVRTNQDYGKIICYCEQISRGEIIQHLNSPLKPRTLDSIKRRTRAQTGRCQGFDCMVNVASIISDHCGIPIHQVTKNGPGTEIVSSQIISTIP